MLKSRALILVILLGGLFSCAPNTYPDKSKLALKGETGNGSILKNENKKMDYYLYLPPGYDDSASASTVYPFMITLHSGYQVNDRLSSAVFATSCVPMLERILNPLITDKSDSQKILSSLDSHLKNSLILIPLCKDSTAWPLEDLKQLVESLLGSYRIDANRLYMTGSSLGGIATYNFAIKYPDWLAAIVPVCGSHLFIKNGALIQNIPSWTFNAFNDDLIPFSDSYMNFLDTLTVDSEDSLANLMPKGTIDFDQTISGTSQYSAWIKGLSLPAGLHTITLYASGGHNIWGRVYATEGLWDWVYSQKKN